MAGTRRAIRARDDVDGRSAPSAAQATASRGGGIAGVVLAPRDAELGAVPSAVPLPFRIINWVGIIDQLVSTQANRLLKPLGLALPQFIMLNHFSHRPGEGKTVSGIARALQQPQPGVTKTIQKLQAKRWLREETHPEDGRSKVLFLTATGLVKHNAAVAVFGRALGPAFDGWSQAELQALFAQLDRLKRWFDENR